MKNEKTAVVLEFVASNASMRAKVQEQGVALNAAGTYVNRYVEAGSVKRTLEAISAKALKWEEAETALIVSGNKGTTVRFGHMSKCKGFFQAKDSAGKYKVLGLDIFGDGSKGGKIEHLTIDALAKRTLKGEETTFVRTAGGAMFTGRKVGSTSNKICALGFGTKEGRLLFVDIETDVNNTHNAHVRGAMGGEEKDAQAVTQAVLEAVAAGKATRKGRSVAVKAQGK